MVQATSGKAQAASHKLQAPEQQASSHKPQA